MAELHARSGEAATLLKALANSDRLALLCQIVDRERSVAELGALTGIQQPTLSQQLGVLRSESLVSTRREGKYVHYRLASHVARDVLRALRKSYGQPPAAASRR